MKLLSGIVLSDDLQSLRLIISIPRRGRGFIPPKAGLAPDRGLIAIGQNQNREPFIFSLSQKSL